MDRIDGWMMWNGVNGLPTDKPMIGWRAWAIRLSIPSSVDAVTQPPDVAVQRELLFEEA